MPSGHAPGRLAFASTGWTRKEAAPPMSSLLESLDIFSVDFAQPATVDIAVESVLRFSPDDWDGNEAIDSARARATSLGNDSAAAVACAGELVAALAIERPWMAADIGHVVRRLADATHTPTVDMRLALYREALADPRLLSLPPGLSIQTSLRLLLAFAPVAAVSFWVVNPAHALRCAVRIGSGARRMRVAAEEAVREGE